MTVEVTSPRGREEPHKENPLDGRGDVRRGWYARDGFLSSIVPFYLERSVRSVCPSVICRVPRRERIPRQDFNEHFSADVAARRKYNTPFSRGEGVSRPSRFPPPPSPSVPLIRLTSRHSRLSLNSIYGSLNAASFVIIHTRASQRHARKTSLVMNESMGRDGPSETYYRALELYMTPL